MNSSGPRQPFSAHFSVVFFDVIVENKSVFDFPNGLTMAENRCLNSPRIRVFDADASGARSKRRIVVLGCEQRAFQPAAKRHLG